MTNLVFWQGALLGLIVGFVMGFFIASLFHKTKYSPEMFLAWVISVIWVFWHVGAGFNVFGVVAPPPTMFDLISGGSVGFILGERFSDYVSGSVGKIFKK